MNFIRTAALTSVLSIAFLDAEAKSVSVSSPSGDIIVRVCDETGAPVYSIEAGGRTIVEPSEFALKVEGAKAPSAIKSGKTTRNIHEHITSPFYRCASFDVDYNRLIITFDNGTQTEWRVYDDGAAFRHITRLKKDGIAVESERVQIKPAGDPKVYLPHSTNPENPMAMAFQNTYSVTPLSGASDMIAFLPVTADMGDGLKLTVLESDLKSYPGMFVRADSTSRTLEGIFAHRAAETAFYPWRKQEYVTGRDSVLARTDGSRTFPWRIFAITTRDTGMPVNNLVYALAEPSKVADTSWIRPGKVAWDWWNDWGLSGVPFKAGINTDTYKYFIDFAADNGIEYVVLDEGWYAPASGDMLTVIPEIDLPGLVAYGKEKGVGIVLWTVFNVLDSQLEEACRTYSGMGVAGFKVDFLDSDHQQAVEMTWRIADACARHKLFLDYHGIYKPVGLNRTYPNVLNFEAVFGMEEMKWSDPKTDMPLYDVTFPYIRMMAGPVDYTPGAMNNASRTNWRAVYSAPMSMGTRAHQLSCYIIHDSPFTMFCDAPTNYRGEEECVSFISSLPVVFDSTKVLDGRLGEYIVTLREKDGSYFVGGATNWDARDITIDFSFLPQGQEFTATIFSDGPNADRQARDYTRTVTTVNSSVHIPLHLASGGGLAMRIDPVKQP